MTCPRVFIKYLCLLMSNDICYIMQSKVTFDFFLISVGENRRLKWETNAKTNKTTFRKKYSSVLNFQNFGDTDQLVAHPGFGQGGGQKFFLRFCRRSKAKSGERVKQTIFYWPMFRVHLRALEALAFLTIKYAFSHFSWYFFFNFYNVHLCGYITKYLFQYERFLAILTNAISIFFIWENQGF